MGLQRSAALTFLDFVSDHVSPRHQMRLNLQQSEVVMAEVPFLLAINSKCNDHQRRFVIIFQHLFAITVAPENQCIVYPYSHTRYFRHVSMSKITMH